jgi:elongator complex protein 3
MLKIYPCLVMEGTELYNEYKKGKFIPIQTEEAVSRIADAAKYFPPWVRIMRMQRDIPAQKICAGVKNGNLHQLVDMELERRGEKLNDIRSREIFSLQRKGKNAPAPPSFKLCQTKYSASGGIEYFLSFEDKRGNLLAGFIRMRFPPNSFMPQIDSNTAVIRELHVYGEEMAIGSEAKKSSSLKLPGAEATALKQWESAWAVSSPKDREKPRPLGLGASQAQHRGFGKRLLLRAEQIARSRGKKKMVIISGVGAREYYRKFGYVLQGAYMCKKLN